MEGATAMRKGQQRWSHASSEREMAAQRATQGGGDVTKGDATTSHQIKREVNERRKAQADKSRASLTSLSGRAIADTVFGWLLSWFG
jgi:hypothetical protein